jgi:hypothetical protein
MLLKMSGLRMRRSIEKKSSMGLIQIRPSQEALKVKPPTAYPKNCLPGKQEVEIEKALLKSKGSGLEEGY